MSAVRAAAVRFRVDPRDVPAAKAARKLGLTEAQFREALPRLRARGFPAPDSDTGHFDLKAIDAWMDQRSGLAEGAILTDAVTSFADRLGALGGKGRRR